MTDWTVSGLTGGVEFHCVGQRNAAGVRGRMRRSLGGRGAAEAMSRQGFDTASSMEWVGKELQTVLSGAPQEVLTFGRVRLGIEASTSAFATDGMTRFSRDVSGDGKRVAVVRNTATSGFDLRIEVADTETRIAARWRPGRQEQVLSRVMKARQRLLLAQALIHYPALWQSSMHDTAVPLAGCVLDIDGKGVLLTGPSGVGKSTLVGRELAAGAVAVSDNLAVVGADRLAHGVVEPIRADFSLLPPDIATPIPGRKTTHGRGEGHLAHREDSIRIDAVVLLRRTGSTPGVTKVDPDVAARELAAATYTAGELRRYWPLAAALAVATGRGPVHPPITESTRQLCGAVPCVELELGSTPGARLRDTLSDLESAPAWT